MRYTPYGLLIYLLVSVSAWAQQAPSAQQSAAVQPTGDPQAVAVVQAAITALGGATAIGQAQSWTFQAQMQGPHANGNVEYLISTDTDTGKRLLRDGTMRPAPLIHSHFVPALVGAILLKESQDPTFTLQYGGTSTIDSKPVTTVIFNFAVGPKFPAQIWTFDSGSLPVVIDFSAPAEIGARQSFPVVVALSDYRSVSGVLYPYHISSLLPGKLPQIVSVQSLVAATTIVANEFTGQGGDLQ
jgi:hypothetical protein